MIRFKVRCMQTVANPSIPTSPLWEEGKEYDCETYRFDNFYIRCEKLFENPYDHCLSLQEFRQYFTTDYRVTEIPPTEFLSRQVLAEVEEYLKKKSA